MAFDTVQVNSMKMNFTPKYSRMVSTDYWTDPQGAASGRAWMHVRSGRWHAVLPTTPECGQPEAPFHRATMMPCRDGSAPQGWSWLLLLKVWQESKTPTIVRARFVPETDFSGGPPRLPMPGTMTQRQLWIYRPEVTNVTELYTVPIDETWTAHELAVAATLYIARPKGDSQGHYRLHDQVWFTKKPRTSKEGQGLGNDASS